LIGGTSFGGAVGGMAGTFCFAANTLVQGTHGPVPIQSIQIGDTLHTGGKVLGKMEFSTNAFDMWDLYGVIVSGSHIVYEANMAYHVSDHPFAKPYTGPTIQTLYCLITSDQTIPIVANTRSLLFADWEEIQSIQDLERWNRQVYETLNPGMVYRVPHKDILTSESVFSGDATIATPTGKTKLSELLPGAIVLDAEGQPTRVEGVVTLQGSEVKQVYSVVRKGTSSSSYASVAAWAWGVHRAVDYLVTDKKVNGKRIAIMGHSRNGKAALLAGATDERIALVIPHQSGCGGAARASGQQGRVGAAARAGRQCGGTRVLAA
jgi:uncharacterized Zn-binding protein involved in type VI secretion